MIGPETYRGEVTGADGWRVSEGEWGLVWTAQARIYSNNIE